MGVKRDRFLDVGGVKPLVDELNNLENSPPAEWALRAAAVGERLERLCAAGDVLARASAEIVKIAKREQCAALLGASALGERLAGAAVASAQDGLRIWDAQSNHYSVLVVDGLMVSGSQVAQAVSFARSHGARRTVAAVLMSAPPRSQSPRVSTDVFVVSS